MMDGVFALNEVMDCETINKRECLLVKVDFATTYDCALWEYLRYMSGGMNFGSRWIRWMETLVFSSSMSILINGSPFTYFEVGRGLRQGGSLYPFLFLIVEEDSQGLWRMLVRWRSFMDSGSMSRCITSFFRLLMIRCSLAMVIWIIYGQSKLCCMVSS